MSRRMNRRRGFSLVEVLAALVLIAIVLPAAMRGITLALQTAAHARHEQEATHLAERQLNTMLALRDPSVLGAGGTFDEWPEYRWEVATSVGDFNLSTVTVYVYWQEQGRERSTSLTTLVLPTQATTY